METPPSTTRVAAKALREETIPNPQSPLQAYQVDDNFTPLKFSIQDVFETIKGQRWVKHPKPKSHDSPRLEMKDYCSFHGWPGASDCPMLVPRKYLKKLV